VVSDEGLAQAAALMRGEGLDERAVGVFAHYYRQLEQGATGVIPEADIEPVTDLVSLDDVPVASSTARQALATTAVIRLNGGLGTSMGMDRAKSLLPVRGEQSFLDLIVAQIQQVRAAYGVRLPLVLMNSFRTREDSLAALRRYDDLAVAGVPLDFVQHKEPKIRVDDLMPVTWDADPDLQWCPPGHGDLYPALLASGALEALLAAGFRYAAVSNSDNLGASPDPRLAGWFAESGAPFAAEVCRRTPADRKGGHIARRSSDGRLVLRETAQTAPEEMKMFTDESRHQYFNTNNLWFDLEQVYETLVSRDAVLGLPLIRNTKTVDPSDPESPAVYQIETAMGAAIEVFEGAQAIEVGRDRFLPVKTTNDLLLLRSDAYDLSGDGRLRRVPDHAPLVDLDPAYYKLLPEFEARFPAGAPSLVGCESLTVRGDWTFGPDVVVRGRAELDATGSPGRVAGTIGT
jgi:UTP--glucose-1-phosphate uridylyltransferase